MASNETGGTATVATTFLAQVRKTPDRIAIRSGHQALTCSQLNARANQFARRLQRSGLSPESLVAICLDVSPDSIAALLGILKAGFAYIALDPGQPADRLGQILREAQPSLILAGDEYVRHFSDEPAVLCLNEIQASLAAEDASDFDVGSTGDSLAYVVFTSGSTGEPKGVMLTHRSILNGLCSTPFDADRPDEICALNTPLFSGFTVSRLFLPLLCGVPLLLVPDSETKDPWRLAAAWHVAAVTSAAVVTPLLREMFVCGPPVLSRMRQLRTLTVGGAVLTGELIAALCRELPHLTVLNGYAASEIGGAAIVWEIGPGESGSRTIQHVFPNTDIYIVDENLCLVPDGLPGELCVAAPHLARGYWRRPDLTAQRFIENRFGGRYERLYRTGDRARRLSNGGIELLGRTDNQVKVRGYRVELDEVEWVVQEHPDVWEAAVVAQPWSDGARLIAYVIAKEGIGPKELRQYLKQKLPDYMVPAAFVIAKELPRTIAGKVDRQALSRRAVTVQGIGGYVAPRNDVEAMLARMWQELLRVERVGVHDHFLELGGDSLLAVQITLEISDRLQVELPLTMIFDRPTVAELAEVIGQS